MGEVFQNIMVFLVFVKGLRPFVCKNSALKNLMLCIIQNIKSVAKQLRTIVIRNFFLVFIVLFLTFLFVLSAS